MNRKERRAAAKVGGLTVSQMKNPPAVLVLHCPGLHGQGCEQQANVQVPLPILGDATRLQPALTDVGWTLAVGRQQGASQPQSIQEDAGWVFDPLCNLCGSRLMHEIAGTNPDDPTD